MTDIAKIAAGLTKRQSAILNLLSDDKKLGLADRQEDRERQGLRKARLIAYCGSPRRWQISSLGLAVKAHLKEPTP